MKLTIIQCQNTIELHTCELVIPLFWNLHIMKFVGFFTCQSFLIFILGPSWKVS